METDKLQKANGYLSDKELKALAYYRASDEYPIGVDLQAQMFELFLNGKSCDQIQKVNPNFGLGQIVSARVEGEWDEKREEYRNFLLVNTQQRVMQSQLEATVLLADILAATNKIYSQRLTKFLQTGDEKHLGDLKINSVRGLKEVVDLLLNLTGQGAVKKVSGHIEHHHTTEVKEDVKAIPTHEASEILKMLSEIKEDK